MPFHKISLGKLECIALEDNSRIIDLRNELPQVPEELLLSAIKENGGTDFHAKVGFNNLLIKTEQYLVLIDSGTGSDKLIESLAEAGFHPKDIDYLVITHSDFDHIGGMDNFAKAKIVFPKTAFDLWTTEISRNKMIESFQEVFLKFLTAEFVAKGVEFRQHYGSEKLPSLLSRMILVKEEEEFLPGFRMVATTGHRPDHFAVEIISEEKTLLHIADGWRHKIQVKHPDWHSIYDSYPDQMAESIGVAIKRAKEKNAILFGAHFEWPGFVFSDY
ncbi:MAG: glyoxylase-like metal-dependent hydrolase (beta-lactamase superfamily II) [Polaribacter sp.]|jgi:glyoxylase-like metal-dependent hydrolase (beta-lactamase superfamily II)